MSRRRGIDLRTARLVAAKELLEALRDRRTLFVALVLPVLLYPLMMLGLAPLVSMQKKKLEQTRQEIVVTGGGRADVIELILDPERAVDDEEPADAGLKVVENDDPEVALTEGDIALWIEAKSDFAPDIAAGKSGMVVVHRDGSDDESRTAHAKFARALDLAADEILAQRLTAQGLDDSWREPVKVRELLDVASPERRSAYLFGKVLSLILVIMTVSSSFYPAVDVVAGEKERGTMETLLVAPCGRAELVLGKFVAVMAVTLAAAFLNLASMGLTMGPLMKGMELGQSAGLQITPKVLLGILLLLVPLAGLFSALSLALSTLARSVKEAQHYMTPLFLFVMPLAMVVILPSVPLTKTLAAVPITNAVLFFRDLLLDKVDLTTAIIVMLTNVAFAALALWACVLLFLREETLFRGPESAGPLISRPAPTARPTATAAVFLFALSLAAFWYGQGALPEGEIVPNLLATQVLIVLAPCLCLAWWMRADFVRTFRLGRPRLLELGLAIPIGLCTPIVISAGFRIFVGSEAEPTGPMKELGEQIANLATEHTVFAVLLIGVLPAVCEELVYRGFIFSGFLKSFEGKTAVLRAVVLSAIFFALFHIMPERYPGTFSLGLIFALLTLRSGAIWPAMLAHALNNGSVVVAAAFASPVESIDGPPRLLDSYGLELQHHATAEVAAFAVVLACVAVLLFLRKTPAEGDAEPDADPIRDPA